MKSGRRIGFLFLLLGAGRPRIMAESASSGADEYVAGDAQIPKGDSRAQ